MFRLIVIITLFWGIFLQGKGQVSKYSVAMGGDYGSRYNWPGGSAYSGEINCRYVASSGIRWGLGIRYSYIKDYFYRFPRGSSQIDKIEYLSLPLSLEIPLFKKGNFISYLFAGFSYHRLLTLESKIYDSTGQVYDNPDLQDTVMTLVKGKGGSSIETGINFRKPIGRHWAINFMPYMQFRIIKIYEQLEGPLGLYPVLPPYVIEDEGQIGIRISLERAISLKTVTKNWNRGDSSHWEIGIVVGDETGLEATFGRKWMLAGTIGYFSLLRSRKWEAFSSSNSYKYAIAYSLGIRRRLFLNKIWKLLIGVELNSRVYYDFYYILHNYNLSETMPVVRYIRFPSFVSKIEYHPPGKNYFAFTGMKYLPFYTNEEYPPTFYSPTRGDILFSLGLSYEFNK